MTEQDFQLKTKELIDSLKAICANYGLGNDGNEFKIITQVFLYKFLNDKFAFEIKKRYPELAEAENWERVLTEKSADYFEFLTMGLNANTAILKPSQFISTLFGQSTQDDFATIFDKTLIDIAIENESIFSVKTEGGAKINLFERLSQYIADPSKRDAFCRAIINKLVEFSFEHIFNQNLIFMPRFLNISLRITTPTQVVNMRSIIRRIP
ncbi:Uncharacterised protein [Rodentibacter pneumotropicus]|uniref:Uncharacterized protein n=1 Tax=Rodentibacter pneumotropicus TaxID=758 RepID=A0A448MQA7_9PAST|nr:Uncharacterised protein [Rodentibacter pneumotropicus]